MLEGTYKMYRDLAQVVPDWETCDKNDLIKSYCALADSKDVQADCYLAAVFCRYWPKIQRFYQNTPLVCTHEDVYDWLVTSILETIQERAWLNPSSKLYQDPKGPDKAVNVKMRCYRLNFLLYVNREKRKTNLHAESFEELHESSGDVVDWGIEQLTFEAYDELEYKLFMQYLYSKKMFFLFFVYDIIMNTDLSSNRKLPNYLAKIDDQYLLDVSLRSGLDLDDVKYAYSLSVKDKSRTKIEDLCNESLIKLRQFYFKGML